MKWNEMQTEIQKNGVASFDVYLILSLLFAYVYVY